MENAILSALFVIEHELDRDPRVTWPARVRWCSSITFHVAGIGDCGRHQSTPFWMSVDHTIRNATKLKIEIFPQLMQQLLVLHRHIVPSSARCIQDF